MGETYKGKCERGFASVARFANFAFILHGFAYKVCRYGTFPKPNGFSEKQNKQMVILLSKTNKC